ncbi:hypothetical protein ASC97_05600 [Rhizobium sp. Root1203]|uniref:phage fiber-tail adaptor protein n=1 Tax=Rhizobium sp. Root1203 TaxID=1736427 RepID=UPI00070F6207|nr:hypothetical protein [Rhizobium sp. Root1203]KQV27841.1 hypothetical protein ASC97_05600 [Rhizobium sp. Root1203]
MSLGVITKAPADVLDYDFDFSRWMPDGDRIATAAAALGGSTALVDRIDTSDTTARVWLSGGQADETAELAVTISTTEGRTKIVTVSLRIREPS